MPESDKGSSVKHSEDCTSGQRVPGTRSIGGCLETSVSPETVDGQNKFLIRRELNLESVARRYPNHTDTVSL